MTAILTPSEIAVNSKADSRDTNRAPELISSPTPLSDQEPFTGSPLDRLIEQWATIAQRHARVRQVDDVYVATVVGLDGAWSDGATPEEALAGLGPVLVDWATLKLEDGDKDVPPMEGVVLVVGG